MVNIREAKITDAERIQLINIMSLGYDFDIETTTTQLAKILDRNNDKIFVAEVDGQVVGYIHGRDYDCTYIEPLKDVMSLSVLADFQGQGLGRKLLAQIEAWAKADGCEGVRLVSNVKRVEAHEFYRRCGYESHKEQKNFFKPLGE
jgi:ribosomal protein S18 acetylase RimI-like enzyme